MTTEEWLSQTPQGKKFLVDLRQLQQVNPNEAMIVWKEVAKGFAEASSGVVRVVRSPQSQQEFLESTSFTTEFPAMLQNPAITAIWNIAEAGADLL